MAKRKAVINGTTVENVILADDDFTPPSGMVLVTIGEWTGGGGGVSPGWTYADGEFSPPEPETPSTNPSDYPLLPWQFKAMVIYLEVDSDIRAAIGQVPDAMQRAATLSRYENSSYYHYDDPLVGQLRQAIGMSVETLTDAWLIAKDLRSSS